MNQLFDYLAEQLATKLKSKKVLVWYDPRNEFDTFVLEIVGDGAFQTVPVKASIGELAFKVVVYTGSYLQIRSVVEPLVAIDSPEPLLIYLPNISRDENASLLMELERAGEAFEWPLKR